MKLTDSLILSLSVAILIIAIHQIITTGFGSAYWMIMLVTLLFFVYSYRKKKEE